jgi:death-on-curing protein
MEDVVFIKKDHILRLHKLAINDFGGAMDIRDAALIDSAISQPMATFGGEYLHATIHEMAAAYFYHISQNQGFSDGNKRTGFLALFTFMKINGYDLTIPSDYLWPVLLRVASGELDKSQLAEFLSQNAIKRFI